MRRVGGRCIAEIYHVIAILLKAVTIRISYRINLLLEQEYFRFNFRKLFIHLRMKLPVLLSALLFVIACKNTGKYPVVSTFAGNGIMKWADGKTAEASFANLMGIAIDNAGNLYIADSHNNRIRKISLDGNVTTLAGNGTVGSLDGKGASASFFYPTGVAVDKKGNVYVADTHNSLIRKISPDGMVTTFAGRRADSSNRGVDSSSARFDNPAGVAVDTNGNVYVSDWANDIIRKIDSYGKVENIAGSTGGPGAKDGTGSSASFYLPWGIAVDMAGNIYVADSYNNMIRKISPDGVVVTLAGSKASGSSDGQGAKASFLHPAGIAVTKAGDLYVADMGNHKIRKISPGGFVTTIAGNGLRGATNGRDTMASFYKPYGVAIDKDGSIYVADYQNNLVRKISF